MGMRLLWYLGKHEGVDGSADKKPPLFSFLSTTSLGRDSFRIWVMGGKTVVCNLVGGVGGIALSTRTACDNLPVPRRARESQGEGGGSNAPPLKENLVGNPSSSTPLSPSWYPVYIGTCLPKQALSVLRSIA